MTEPLTADQQAVLTVLAERGGKWSSRDDMIFWSRRHSPGRPLDGMTPAAISLAATSLARIGYVAKARPRNQMQYKINPSGRVVLEDSRKTGPPPFPAHSDAIAWARWEDLDAPEAERVIAEYHTTGLTVSPSVMVGITSRGAVLLGEPGLRETEWHHRIADSAGIAGLQQVLEQATADKYRIDRQVHPAPLRRHIRALLADCPQTSGRLRECIAERSDRWTGADVQHEIHDMRDDGEVTGGDPCWVLTVKGNKAAAR